MIGKANFKERSARLGGGIVNQKPDFQSGHAGLHRGDKFLLPGIGDNLPGLDAIPEPKRRRKAAPALPAFQPLRRDFAFLVPEATPADALIRAAKGAERNLITNVTLFDRYAGKNLPEGQISLAIAVTLQPVEKSLTEAEIEAVSAKIVAAVAKATGGVLRG